MSSSLPTQVSSESSFDEGNEDNGSEDLPHPGEEEDGNDDEQEVEEEVGELTYGDLLNQLSEKWLLVQLTHDVSATATNSFWDAAMKLLPDLLQQKETTDARKKIPGFIHLRNKQFKEKCPEVHVKHVYLNKGTQEIVISNNNADQNYPKSHYKKLYEEAHVKVIFLSICLSLYPSLSLSLSIYISINCY